MDTVALLVQLVSGAVGGNVAGSLLKKLSLGTVGNSIVGILGGGLGAVLLRNVVERRRELALLGAVGYRARHLATMILAESVLLLGTGLLAGVLAAALAIAPALSARGGPFPVASTLALLAAVFVAGLVSSLAATRAAASGRLLRALRSE